jgi:hypothetical protein
MRRAIADLVRGQYLSREKAGMETLYKKHLIKKTTWESFLKAEKMIEEGLVFVSSCFVLSHSCLCLCDCLCLCGFLCLVVVFCHCFVSVFVILCDCLSVCLSVSVSVSLS